MSNVPEGVSQVVAETVYGFIQSYLAEHGYLPSHLEILDGCAIDRSTLARSLTRLEVHGRIRTRLGKPRALVLVDSA